MMQKIRNEGLKNSQVMDIAFYLTEVSGPRLQSSPGYKRAANWAKNKLAEWGLQSKLEPWGDWGKGWELQRSYVAMTQPYYKPIHRIPQSWTSGTNGLKTADVILLNAKDSTELMNYKGKLKGKDRILLPRNDTMKPKFRSRCTPLATTKQLGRMAAFNPKNQPARQRGNFPGGQSRSYLHDHPHQGFCNAGRRGCHSEHQPTRPRRHFVCAGRRSLCNHSSLKICWTSCWHTKII